MIFCLFACNGITVDESQTLFDALYQPIYDLRDQWFEESTPEDPIEFEKTQGSNWEGSITISGIREDYESTEHYTLEANFSQVYVTTGDLFLDGILSVYMEFQIDATDNESYEQSIALKDEIVVSGDVTGKAILNYTLFESYQARDNITNTTTSGTIAGHDVSSYLQGNTP